MKEDKVWKAIRRKYFKVPDEISANSKVRTFLQLFMLCLQGRRQTGPRGSARQSVFIVSPLSAV